ncbi:slit homolog 2 protein [Lingula anatina]|uniref:Slit homolog 2 protein n=1 Tax=Lingula anatina TaxID=7574 RepID=A0A1S3J1B1_LINAN|nr:slit homolog 2 protein [Lingula anatina]XP_013404221.1 slit homolog 2 protein [Lingula anatina]XP_013404230.1 slit homolog 2 protein [Lingula anatina]XP_013404238.1 slit homolog 2 protein [Lingula anatina]XP_013404247.1 slit homolog 2 protein [Lingula anatina]|eukprot:XP_013404210.1 slit homolog 2 protein [Lingula anatina]
MEDGGPTWHLFLQVILVFGCAPFIDTSCPGGCSCTIEIVDCRNGDHTQIPWNLPDVTSVKEMYLNHNHIVSIVAELREYGNLEVLDLSDNQISLVSNFSFITSRSLKVLSLSSNRMTSLKANTFVGLTSLQVLLLSGNSFSHLDGGVFAALTSLNVLDLSSSGIFSIDTRAFDGLRSLRTLNLSTNSLTSVPSAQLRQVPNLVTLTLDDNKIKTLPEEALSCDRFPKLQTLSIKYNRVMSVSKAAFIALNCRSNLKTLLLNGNLLTEVPTDVIRDLPDLHEIDISSNLVSTIRVGAFSDLPELQKISFSYMPQLTVIEKGAFTNLHSLTYLKISHNSKLREVQHGAAFACPSLISLSLRGNAVESIGQLSFPWEQLTHVDLVGNPWRCNCDLQWMKRLLLYNQSKAEALSRDLVTCKSPHSLAGKRITELNADDFKTSCNHTGTNLFSNHIALGLSLGVFAVTLVVVAAVLFRHRTRIGRALQKKCAFKKRKHLSTEDTDDLCFHEDARSMTPIVLNGSCNCPNHSGSA